jgi:peptide/nickel transport system permease protein
LVFIARRLLSLLPVLLIISFVSYTLVALLPGDAVVTMLAGDQMNVKTMESLRRELGLDKPLPIRYLSWLGHVVQGDMGRSLRTSTPVAEAIVERLAVTGILTSGALLLSLLVGIPLGISVGTRINSVWDRATTVFTSLAVATPGFWLGMILVMVFAQHLKWLPAFGYSGASGGVGKMLAHLVLPIISLSLSRIAEVTRQVRSALADVMAQDYVRTARAKGLGSGVVVWKHAMRNVLIPVVALTGLSLGQLIGGAVIAESVFSLPGLGLLAVGAVNSRDYSVVQGVALVTGLGTLLASLVADLCYAAIDPRIRYQ